jgi:flavodoxin
MKTIAFAILVAFAALAWSAAPACAQSPNANAAPETPAPPFAAHFGKTVIIVYSVTGNSLNMAERIRARTGGDIVQLETEETYPVGENLIPYAKKERDELRKPTLKLPLPDISGYDTVFLGTPVWFHELPAAMSLFLDAMDFQGKPLVPFLTAGGGPGDSMDSLRSSAKNARVLEHKVITRYASRPAEDIDKEIDVWLATLRDGPQPEGGPDVPDSRGVASPGTPPASRPGP